jgi:hypothetical protein
VALNRALLALLSPVFDRRGRQLRHTEISIFRWIELTAGKKLARALKMDLATGILLITKSIYINIAL